jgi:SH3-like domain-containing protein
MFVSSFRFFVAILAFALFAPGGAWAAEENGKENGSSGLALPRFASLKSDNVYVRAGPSMDYPIRWIYQREGLPVEIILEYDAWRKIRDPEGEVGWVHKILLSGNRTARVTANDPVTAFHDPDGTRPVAKIEPGVIVGVKECGETFCDIQFSAYEGWVEKKSLWGVYPSEILN